MKVKNSRKENELNENNNPLFCTWYNFRQLRKEAIQNLGRISKERKDKFDIIFTSDLKRAIESAEIAFPDIPKVTDKRLRECNYGEYDGKGKNLVIYEEHTDSKFPNGESLKDVEKRINELIDFIRQEYAGKTIGIVAHRASQLALEVILNKKTWSEAIESDWRKTGDWQPGWKYIIEN